MTKHSILFYLLMLWAAGALAQTGIRVGYNSATIGGDASGNTTTSGFHAGLFFMKHTKEKVGTMFEILYSAQGTQSINGSVKFSYKYITLPFLVNLYLSNQFFAQVGAQPGVLISADANGTNLMDQLNTFDFALALGAGVDLDRVLLNVRYNLGLTTTAKQATGHFPNMVLQLSLGIKLSGGGK